MIDLTTALNLVTPHLAAIARQEDAPVMVTAAERIRGGWRITYNTEEYVETGNVISGLLGNLAIEIGDDGELRQGQ